MMGRPARKGFSCPTGQVENMHNKPAARLQNRRAALFDKKQFAGPMQTCSFKLNVEIQTG